MFSESKLDHVSVVVDVSEVLLNILHFLQLFVLLVPFLFGLLKLLLDLLICLIVHLLRFFSVINDIENFDNDRLLLTYFLDFLFDFVQLVSF
jgi:hypothetical protein